MKIIEFSELVAKKDECERVRKFLMDGKMPIDLLVEAQKEHIQEQANVINLQAEYINHLKELISAFEEENRLQKHLIELLEQK